MTNILKKLYDNDKRDLKKFEKIANKVEKLADHFANMTDEQLQPVSYTHLTLPTKA